MKKIMMFACVVLLAAFFSPQLEAQSVICSNAEASGSQPEGITTDKQGNVWAAFYEANEVVKFGPGCVREAIYSVTNTGPTDVAFDGTYIWVTLYNGNQVVKINATTGIEVNAYPTGGANPRGVIFDGTYIWVANYGSNNITKINPSTGFVLNTVPVGSGPYFLAFNGLTQTVWVPNRNSASISVVNESGVVVNTIATGSEPQFVAWSGGSDMFVSCYASQLVEEFSSTGALEASYAIAGHGQPLGIFAIGDIVWGVTHVDGYLFGIYNGVVHYTDIGGGDWGITYDPSHGVLWVTNNTQGFVSEVSTN